MKIAIVLPSGYAFDEAHPNSIETVIRTLNAPHDFGHDITVFCDSPAKQRSGLNVIEIAATNRLQFKSKMIETLRAYDPDFIEFHQQAIELRPIAKALKRPCALYRHNEVKAPKHWFDRIKTRLRHDPYSALIFVSEAMKKAFQGQFPDKTCYSLANAIEATLWPGDARHKSKTIAFAGRASPEKGFAPLVAGILQALLTHKDWGAELVLGRFDTHKDWAQGELAKLDPVMERVTLRKDQPLSQVKLSLKDAAIAVIPSLWQEPFGLAALEAHAAGCAVISSGRGGLREASGDHAYYLNEVTGDEIAEALNMLISDDAKRLTLAQSGQDFVRSAHNPETRKGALNEIRLAIVAAFTAGS